MSHKHNEKPRRDRDAASSKSALRRKERGDIPHARDQGNANEDATPEVAGATGSDAKGSKVVMADRILGVVKWYDSLIGHGFVRRVDHGGDVEIHRNNIVKPFPCKYQRSLGAGETVEFEVVQGRWGPEATKVTGPGGIPLEGSRPPSHRHGVRKNLDVYRPVPSRGQQGSHQDKTDPCVLCRLSTLGGGGHRHSPCEVKDREAISDLGICNMHRNGYCCVVFRCPASPEGPRSSDAQEGGKDSPSGSHKRSEGREVHRGHSLAAGSPRSNSHGRRSHRATPAGRQDGTKLQPWAFRQGSSIHQPVSPARPKLPKLPEQLWHEDKGAGYATAQGHLPHRPDLPRGRPVHLPPLQRAPAVACGLGPSSGPHASDPPGGPLTAVPAPPWEPGARYDVLSHPRGQSSVGRSSLSPSASENPGGQDAQGRSDACRSQASARKDQHCHPQAPSPSGVRSAEGTTARDPPAPPGEKPRASKEDPAALGHINSPAPSGVLRRRLK